MVARSGKGPDTSNYGRYESIYQVARHNGMISPQVAATEFYSSVREQYHTEMGKRIKKEAAADISSASSDLGQFMAEDLWVLQGCPCCLLTEGYIDRIMKSDPLAIDTGTISLPCPVFEFRLPLNLGCTGSTVSAVLVYDQNMLLSAVNTMAKLVNGESLEGDKLPPKLLNLAYVDATDFSVSGKYRSTSRSVIGLQQGQPLKERMHKQWLLADSPEGTEETARFLFPVVAGALVRGFRDDAGEDK